MIRFEILSLYGGSESDLFIKAEVRGKIVARLWRGEAPGRVERSFGSGSRCLTILIVFSLSPRSLRGRRRYLIESGQIPELGRRDRVFLEYEKKSSLDALAEIKDKKKFKPRKFPLRGLKFFDHSPPQKQRSRWPVRRTYQSIILRALPPILILCLSFTGPW